MRPIVEAEDRSILGTLSKAVREAEANRLGKQGWWMRRPGVTCDERPDGCRRAWGGGG